MDSPFTPHYLLPRRGIIPVGCNNVTPHIIFDYVITTDKQSLAKYKNLTRWYNEISKREAVQRGFAFMNKEEFPPKP